jgi:GNAT superfamily N-acetyltransferase
MEQLIGLTGSVVDSALLCPYTRRFRSSDRPAVTSLLSVLPRLYPGGSEWLQRRLTDSLNGRAECIVVQDINSLEIAGVAIVTPKTAGSLKLSTFYVTEEYRSQGLGSLLLKELFETCDQQSINDIYVTVAHHIEDSLARLIEPADFRPVALIKDRYGPGRHEGVWRRT